MVALQDEEREEEPLHLVAPDMGGTTERGPLDKAPAPAPATLEAASVEEDEVEEDDVDPSLVHLLLQPWLLVERVLAPPYP